MLFGEHARLGQQAREQLDGSKQVSCVASQFLTLIELGQGQRFDIDGPPQRGDIVRHIIKVQARSQRAEGAAGSWGAKGQQFVVGILARMISQLHLNSPLEPGASMPPSPLLLQAAGHTAAFQ
jgi:hypothetical protein